MQIQIRDRLLAASGALYVLLVIVGNQIAMSGNDQSAHPSGEAVLRDVARQVHSTKATVGMTLEVLGFVAFMVFLAFLYDAFRRRLPAAASHAAAGLSLLAGVMLLIIKVGSIAPVGALMLDHERITPALAQVLADMNGFSFVVTFLPYAIFVGAGAVALRQAALVGKVAHWAGLVIGIGGLLLAFVALNDSANGNPMGFLLGLVWTLGVSIRLAVRPRVAVAEPSYGAAAPVPAAA
jgi:hypothetical protein